MNNIITLPNGRVFDLEKDELTTQDMREMTGEQVRYINKLQYDISIARGMKRAEEFFKKTGIPCCAHL